MIKIRSIKEACQYIRSIDEDTGITENAIRSLVLSGQIPSVMIGKKHLINAEQVLLFFEDRLSQTPKETIEKDNEIDDIKPVAERVRAKKIVVDKSKNLS